MTSSHILIFFALMSGVKCILVSPAVSGYATSTNIMVWPTPTSVVTPPTNYTDHCVQGTDNCTASLAQCVTTAPGSYLCVCVAGRTGDGQGPNGCTDIDECTNGLDTCHPNATCTNTPGSHTCACDPRFTGDGTDCTDTRLCGNSGNICHANATCKNSACVCNAGYTGNGVECTDIDECSQSVCHSQATCTNLEGSFHCKCPPNLSGDGIECSDACSSTQCPDSSTCYVYGNKSECTCNSGRFLKTNNNGVQQCILADHVVQARGLRLRRTFKVEYYNIYSVESRILLREVEAAVFKILIAIFRLLTGVQGVRISPGSTVVDFIALFSQNDTNEAPPASLSVETELLNAVRNDSLENIDADNGSNLTVVDANACAIGANNCTSFENCVSKANSNFECVCKDEYFKANESCLLKRAYSRGEMSFIYKKIWDADLTNVTKQLYLSTTLTINNQISTSLNTQFPLFAKSHIYFHVTKYSEKDKLTAVSGRVSYLYQVLTPLEQRQLCNALRAFKYSGDNNDFEAFNFISYECCYPDTFGEESFKGIYSYETTLRSKSVSKSCTYSNGTSFERSCLGNGIQQAKWQDVESLSLCKAFTKTTEELIELEKVNVCTSNQTFGCVSVVETAQNLSAVVSSGSSVTNSQDIKSVTEIVNKIIDSATVNESVQILQDILVTVSNVMDVQPEIIQVAEQRTKSASRILTDLDTFANKLADTIADDGDVTRSTPNIGVRVAKIQPQNYSLIVELDKASNISLEKKSAVSAGSTYKGEVIIPESTFQSYPGGFGGKIYAYAFRNEKLFVSNKTNETKVDIQGVIVSVKLGDKRVTGDPAVRLKFKKDDKFNKTFNTSLCSYWKIDKNVSANSRWDQTGCRLESEIDDVVTCACDHFTHFAILFNLGEVVVSLVLDIISYIGCGLSLVGLILTIIAHAFNKVIRRKLPSRILVCFAISLSMVLILFLAGVSRTESKVGCQVVAGLLMYFMLTTFTWMAVTAISLYQLIVLVFRRNDKKFFQRANLVAWGLPLIVVVVTGAAAPESLAPIAGTKDYCFVSGNPFYFGVVMPVCLIILMNLVILVFTMVKLARTPPVNATQREKKETMSQARIAFSCSILLGVTWALGLFAVGQLTFTVQLFFCIFNAFQGFFIFVLYTLMNPVIRADIMNYCRCGAVRESFSTQGRYTVSAASTRATSRGGEIAYSTST